MRSEILSILSASEYFRKHRQALLDSQFALLSCHKVGKASPVIRLHHERNTEVTLMGSAVVRSERRHWRKKQ